VTRFLPLLLLPLMTAAGLALADGPAAEPTAKARLLQFQRDRQLLRQLVDGAVGLAAEDDPLRRADRCGNLAGGLAQEVQKAVAARERGRADVLGGHLETLLVRGVAGNLYLARSTFPEGSPRASELSRLGDRVTSLMQPLQHELERVPNAEQEHMQAVIDAVSAGRAEVERAVKGPRTRGTKAPPAGKKLQEAPK
jgi:hypothetical protein